MYGPRFCLRSFDSIALPQKIGVIEFLLNALTGANVAYLLIHPATPRLYQAGIPYVEEPDGRDDWQDIPETLARREGDCEDLGCWRMAELRVHDRDLESSWHITVADLPNRAGDLVTTYHIQIQRPEGVAIYPPAALPGNVEDPSRALGMK